MLETLRLQLLSLSVTAPYYYSRLLRITQQLDYVGQAWPADDWPVRQPPESLSRRQIHGLALTRQQFLEQIAEVESRALNAEQPPGSYAGHQHLLDLLLCLG